MRKRNLIPEEYKTWLDCYLERKAIVNYPDLDANQWRTLQGAYRQMILKSKTVSNSINDKTLFSRNLELVAERDKAVIDLRTSNNGLDSKQAIIEKQKQSIKDLKKALKQAATQVLGQGVYEGSIQLSIAVKLLPAAPKDSAKQSALRNKAVMECGYSDLTERKLNKLQRVEVYNHIIKLCAAKAV